MLLCCCAQMMWSGHTWHVVLSIMMLRRLLWDHIEEHDWHGSLKYAVRPLSARCYALIMSRARRL